MFHFPTFPPHALCVQARVTPHDWCGVPPFGNPRINARLTAPRGLSQPPTSFIGSWCQGIHRAPLTTWPHKNPTHHTPGRTPMSGTYTNPQIQGQKMLASTVQFSTYDQTPPTRPRRTRAPPQGRHGGTRTGGPCRRKTVTRSLRTQQRAYEPDPPHHSALHAPPQGRVLGARHAAGRTGQRSTLELHPTHMPAPDGGTGPWCGRGSAPPPRAGAASAP